MSQLSKKHIGVVIEIVNKELLKVKIARNQCEGCKMGDLCGVSSDDEVYAISAGYNPSVGERVKVVETQNKTEVEAIWWCLFMPCLLLMIVTILTAILVSPFIGCLSGLLSITLYFIIYYILRGKKESKKVSFKIEEI